MRKLSILAAGLVFAGLAVAAAPARGGGATDILQCFSTNVTITGAGVINETSGDDVICGGDGDDHISGDNGNDTMYGGSGSDFVASNRDDDHRLGNSGNDNLVAFAVNISLNGGPAPIVATATATPASPTPRARTRSSRARTDFTTALGKEEGDATDPKLARCGEPDAAVTGGDDKLNGGSGDDTINGNSGGDFIFGFGGEDSVNGGSGRDECELDGDESEVISCEITDID